MTEGLPPRRADYPVFRDITTRWMDNDVYGHINNVTYYSFFDTAVNAYLIEAGGLDIRESPIIGYVVESQCRYRQGLAYPDRIQAGLRVEHLGRSSVRYGIGIFREDALEVSAWGQFVHVFVDRHTERPVPLQGRLREALERIHVDGHNGLSKSPTEN